MATTTKAKGKSAPDAIMATSFIKPARLKKTGVKVLTSDETIESYPACRMSELHNLAERFNWLIMPLGLCDFGAIIKAYSRENVYYAWQLFHAFERFRKISNGKGRMYIICPPDFLNLLNVFSKYDGVESLVEDTYYPENLRELQKAYKLVQPVLETASRLIQDLQKKLESAYKPRILFEEKKDPCIFITEGNKCVHNKNTVCRIGLCWGEELTDYIVDDLPDNKGAFSSVTYPWSKELVKKVTVEELDKDEKIRDKYFFADQAYDILLTEFSGASYHRDCGGAKKLADETYAMKALEILPKAFPTKFEILNKIQVYVERYFKFDGSLSCLGRECNFYGKPKHCEYASMAYSKYEKRKRYDNWAKFKGCERLEICWEKMECAEKIHDLCMEFYREFHRDYYVSKLKGLYKEQKYQEMLDFIPLIDKMEKKENYSYRVKGIKENFPEFWTFYEMVRT